MTQHFLEQQPAPGLHLLKTRGDTIELTLILPEKRPGRAWIRTNLGHGHTVRREIMRAVTHDEPLLGRDWYDLQMVALDETDDTDETDDRRFRITLGLSEVGHFEAKCYFLPEGEFTPVWPPGDNVSINVLPTDTCCANIVYNAFVRQFGPNKDGTFTVPEKKKETIRGLDDIGYTIIPPSGTFRDLIAELDFIIDYLGCRFIQLLPINPTPTTYGRMGRYGSPYASLDFTSIDPALAEFDPKATPLEQFIELVDAIHSRSGRLILDIAPNHTGWAAELHETHPEWLVRDDTGHIEAPGAWGVTWADLARLDYRYKDLWQYMGEVFLTWCRRGVDGFRCDAGYMIPAWAWMYIIAAVREEFPETLFFLEGLGGKLSVTRQLLNKGGFDWAYSELFQNYDRGQITHYLPEPLEISEAEGLMLHFAETHDNNRLASTSTRFAAMRTALCALCAHQGAFGFANGVEWFADEKIDVHKARSLNWGSESNQVERIRRINTLLKTHPAFFDQTEIRMIQTGEGEALVFLRHHRPTGKRLLVVVNLDWENPGRIAWNPEDAGIPTTRFIDLLSDEKIAVETGADNTQALTLPPGAVYCLSPEKESLPTAENLELPERIARQRLRAAALDVYRAFYGTRHLEDFDPEARGLEMAGDPVAFCRRMNPEGDDPRVIAWQWPADQRREVMVPPGHFLMLSADAPFRARLVEKNGKKEKTSRVADSFKGADGGFFALIPPRPVANAHIRRTLRLSVFQEGAPMHADCPLLYLGRPERPRTRRIYSRRALKQAPLKFLATNGRGAMMRAHGAWGQLDSKYDALLAANLNPDFPDDRRILLSRCRAWLVFQGYSQEVSIDCQQQFRLEGVNAGAWHFTAPCGQGQHVGFRLAMEMTPGQNHIRISAYRQPADGQPDRLADDRPVKLIVRPDIDDRNFHENTKAYLGPEHEWPKKCRPHEQGFTFSPAPDRALTMTSSAGQFVHEPEWQYMVHLPVEAERGMDPDTDLFSPGYFAIYLKGDDLVHFTAVVDPASKSNEAASESDLPSAESDKTASVDTGFDTGLKNALKAYIVRRQRLHTVIAGYPWFLDWGRDTLIVVRGLIAAGYTSEAETILLQFAAFEEKGTLPNMIRGMDAGNRDTSDAPLWFFVACADLMAARGNQSLLNKDCGAGRRISDVLRSIAEGYIAGTPNGIRMDPESGLIYSPAHFTWMDTNHPAGSPRQGYPIEIQALWHFALRFLDRIAGPDSPDRSDKSDSPDDRDWQALAAQVKASIADLFALPGRAWLADCLHAEPGSPAGEARANDALRPNQLFAVTLGAVTEKDKIEAMLRTCMELLVPGAIRSLADRPVECPLPVWHEGSLLNDPHHPYQGIYTGDEDRRRKPAYHNGTAWTWVFPSFCEAWVMAYGESGKEAARAWLSSSTLLLDAGCAGQIPEILDGDYPHTQRGCDAQAWGVSEVLRVWLGVSEEGKL